MINLTQHTATPEQSDAGVVAARFADRLPSLLTFVGIPSPLEIRQRAEVIASLAAETGAKCAMIGGAPFFMGPLEVALHAVGIRAVFAFSDRVSVEEAQADGSVRKVNVFRHIGFAKSGMF